MRSVFVDTGAWIALAHEDDRWHVAAQKQLRLFSTERVPLITTSYVIDEAATRLRYDAGLMIALAFRERLSQARKADRLRVVWIDERLEAQGWSLFGRHADVQLSLTDAVSAAVARAHSVREIFGFDQDFRALGFTLLPEP